MFEEMFCSYKSESHWLLDGLRLWLGHLAVVPFLPLPTLLPLPCQNTIILYLVAFIVVKYT